MFVQLIDVTPGPRGKLLLALEFCETDLNRVLTHGLKLDESRALPPAEVKTIMRMLLQGLAHCHDNGIIHLVSTFD